MIILIISCDMNFGRYRSMEGYHSGGGKAPKERPHIEK
jgi:hypothetical protein